MDTAVLLLKREEIQRRMEMRRQEATALASSRKFSFLTWFLKTGVNVLGFAGRSESRSLLWSLAAPLVIPFVLKAIGHKNETFLQKLLRTVLPGHFAKDRSF